MHSLMKLAVDGKVELWDKHFKPVLLILLETLADDDVSIFKKFFLIYIHFYSNILVIIYMLRLEIADN